VHLHREAVGDLVAQIDATPTHDTIARGIRTGQHQSLQFGHLLARQHRRPPGSRRVGKARNPRSVIAMHPVTERLTIHPAGTRSIGPGETVQHMGDRQNAARDTPVLASCRLLPKRRRGQVQPRDLNRLPHVHPARIEHHAKRIRTWTSGESPRDRASQKFRRLVLHLNDAHSLTFGEQDGSLSARAEAIAAALSGARFEARLSETILQEMWEKWVFIATGAGITCLMRAAVGDIVAAGAAELAAALLDECAAIAARQGFPPRQDFPDRVRRTYTEPGSLLTTSMLRDIERGARTEGDHILGDLLRRAGPEASDSARLLRLAWAHVATYEARRTREQASQAQAAV
jgi:Ketopantoate reductase PanE/ApbA C terminal